MSVFTSAREKQLWSWTFAVLLAIFISLFAGRPLARFFGDQNMQAAIFAFGMFLTASAMLIHAIKSKPSRIELSILFGIAAVYIMLILRLGVPERSHLFEYSVLAICIHKALMERSNNIKMPNPAILAMAITIVIGALDECLQIFLPTRVFDPVDILFNSFVVALAIGSHVFLVWIRHWVQKPK